MILEEDVPFKSLTTFAVAGKASRLAEARSVKDLEELKDSGWFAQNQHLVLGGGSNVLFLNDFHGTLIKFSAKGIFIEKQEKNFVYVRAMAGEDWPGFVVYCVEKGWGGIENLTMIPGNVGTSPMQNIGAYGVELKDTFFDLQAWEIATGKVHTFTAADCRFGYRDSFFKNEGKGKFVILSVCFRLTISDHQIISHYGAVNELLAKKGINNPDIKNIMEAIQWIRRSKLPDPDELGNAGSFFKNPVIPADQFAQLISQYPDLPSYTAGNGMVKIAAGWLIEKAGWKGYRKGDAGVHAKQALVLVNYGNATGKEIFDLSENIRNSVINRFGITLEREVNVIQ